MESLKFAVHGDKLKPLCDAWVEVQRILGCKRLDAVTFTERAFLELEAVLFLRDEHTGLYFPLSVEKARAFLDDMGTSTFAHDPEHPDTGWRDWRVTMNSFESIIGFASGIANADPRSPFSWADDRANDPDDDVVSTPRVPAAILAANPSPPQQYSTPWLRIVRETITNFFEPRRNPDAKKEEVVDWIVERARASGGRDSRNIAEAIFTIIKPEDHDPRKRRAD